MSRREDHSSESKRYRSRFDREPSPKRYRRDGKVQTERPVTEPELDKDRLERDHKHRRRRLQDPLPLEAPLSHDSKVESGTVNKESENRGDGHQGGTKHSSDPTKVPQARSYFQHDDRGSAGQNGRSFSRRTDNERGWWRDPKEQHTDKAINRTVSSDAMQKDEKAKDNKEDNHPWRHDGYLEMEANPEPPARKRSFREQKLPADPDKTNKAASYPVLPKPQSQAVDSGRRDDRGHNHRHSDRPERPFSGERESNKGQTWRGNFSSRDRLSGSSRYRGRDGFAGRQDYRPTGGRVEKWKHDLYDEANRSPTPKNEEDQISKIEALLAS